MKKDIENIRNNKFKLWLKRERERFIERMNTERNSDDIYNLPEGEFKTDIAEEIDMCEDDR